MKHLPAYLNIQKDAWFTISCSMRLYSLILILNGFSVFLSSLPLSNHSLHCLFYIRRVGCQVTGFARCHAGNQALIIRCVFDVLSETSDSAYKIMMYMNFKDYDNYHTCENTYWGYMEHYDALAQKLKVSREDIRLLKLYNMLSVL